MSRCGLRCGLPFARACVDGARSTQDSAALGTSHCYQHSIHPSIHPSAVHTYPLMAVNLAVIVPGIAFGMLLLLHAGKTSAIIAIASVLLAACRQPPAAAGDTAGTGTGTGTAPCGPRTARQYKAPSQAARRRQQEAAAGSADPSGMLGSSGWGAGGGE
jgi:hypothetical protein